MTKRAKSAWFAHHPAEQLDELMALRDADAVYFLIQIRNMVLLRRGPFVPDHAHLGGLCGKGPKIAARVIHRLLHDLPEPDLYMLADGRISSRKADDLLMETRKILEKNQNDQKIGVESRMKNKTNQELNNYLLKKNYLPIPYRTVPLSLKNLKPIPLVPSAARGRLGQQSVREVLGGMLQAAGAVCLRMEELDVVHLRAMLELYPGRDRGEILALFNGWVAEECRKGLVVRDKDRLFMSWLKRSTWLGKPAMGCA
jgi:hypothetical protein